MIERVKVDASRVRPREEWYLWMYGEELKIWRRHVGSFGGDRDDAARLAAYHASQYSVPFMLARHIGDPEAVVVSREHPEGVPVEWVGGEQG